MTKEEYKKNVIRMWDSIRDEAYKGTTKCVGVLCENCPLHGACGSFYVFETLELVENWAKEHQIKTNADKFREVFGTEPSKSTCVNDIDCENCEYYVNGECDVCDQFWNAEYNLVKEGGRIVADKPDVVEKSKIDKAITQLEEEKEFAYADFEEYNEEVLSYDDTDVCERDSCYIGLARAIEILKRI